jgi:hypothetical protein
VRNSNPYPISLNLRQLRNIFNMVELILACHDIQLAKDIPVNYMDLNFYVS